jgi:hypothetical protein
MMTNQNVNQQQEIIHDAADGSRTQQRTQTHAATQQIVYNETVENAHVQRSVGNIRSSNESVLITDSRSGRVVLDELLQGRAEFQKSFCEDWMYRMSREQLRDLLADASVSYSSYPFTQLTWKHIKDSGVVLDTHDLAEICRAKLAWCSAFMSIEGSRSITDNVRDEGHGLRFVRHDVENKRLTVEIVIGDSYRCSVTIPEVDIYMASCVDKDARSMMAMSTTALGHKMAAYESSTGNKRRKSGATNVTHELLQQLL